MTNAIQTFERRADSRVSLSNGPSNDNGSRPLVDGADYTTGYPPCDDHSIVVDVFRMANDDIETFEAQLLDLSHSGLKLFVRSKIEIGESIGLRIQFKEMEIDVATAAIVCWLGFKRQGHWIIGCSLAKELPEEAFQKIVESGYLERRREERKKVSKPARIRREDDAARPIDVRLDDISIGGFCMFSSEPFEKGDRVLLESDANGDSDAQIPAEVRWKLENQFGYSIGCRFLARLGYDNFLGELNQSWPDAPRDNASRDPQNEIRLSTWGWAGLVTVFAWPTLQWLLS